MRANALGRGLLVAAFAASLSIAGCARGTPSVQTTGPATSPSASSTATTSATTPSSPAPTSNADSPGPHPGYDQATFSTPTTIDNPWMPLVPGTQMVLEGDTVEEGKSVHHRVVHIVTDLHKTIDGVTNVVVLERDFSGGALEENEIAFFAQADDGSVWHFGQYPEVYDGDTIEETPAWIHGIAGARAGVSMEAHPKRGEPSHSQGWGPAVAWTDRARVHAVGKSRCVAAGCYRDLLVVDEFSLDEPGAHQLKSYAKGVGLVHVGWAGTDPTMETLELVSVTRLSATQLADARKAVLAAEKRSNSLSPEVMGRTAPLRR